MKIETALILCAGYGKRVKPLTDVTPKPLLKIKNLTLLQRCIKLIESLDINRIYLNTFYLQDEIKNYIKNNNFKAKISIVDDGEQILDTGGGILNLINSYEGAALKRIDRRLLTRQLPCDGAQQACVAVHTVLAGIHQNEGASAKGALGGAPVKACLPEQCRLLITSNARDGHAIGQPGYPLRAA